MTPSEIKQTRLEAGLTQAKAAALLGVALRTFQSWEDDGPNGRTMPAPAQKLFQLLSKELYRSWRFT